MNLNISRHTAKQLLEFVRRGTPSSPMKEEGPVLDLADTLEVLIQQASRPRLLTDAEKRSALLECSKRITTLLEANAPACIIAGEIRLLQGRMSAYYWQDMHVVNDQDKGFWREWAGLCPSCDKITGGDFCEECSQDLEKFAEDVVFPALKGK